MALITEFWAQVTVLLGVLGYILKVILDNRLKSKELRYRYFYEIKSSKIIELYTKIVELQMVIDRRKRGEHKTFEGNVFKHRVEFDKYYWESYFYFSKKTQKAFHLYLKWLKFFESKAMMNENPEIEFQFKKITNILIKEFKNEVK